MRLSMRFKASFLPLLLTLSLFGQNSESIKAPYIVATPPSDGSRGLVRVSKNEIRHYSGDRTKQFYLVSKDNGQTWSEQTAPASYPKNFGGITKESPAFAQNPKTNEWIRIQPTNSLVFTTKGGIDGQWLATTKDGKLTADWQNDQTNLLRLGGIIRNPLFVNNGNRIIVPFHSMRSGTSMHISDDGGITWRSSKGRASAPPFVMEAPHKGRRWLNSGLEGSVVELKDGQLWMLLRTSQDQYYETFSSDFGDTWSQSQPSRFFGTLTMPTVGRLRDGRLIALWTNTMALPENKSTANSDMWEDVFTNRDSHHMAISSDEGKTWTGFRELILDEHRNRSDYATYQGAEDRGKHQSEFLVLDKNRILVSLGQHKEHRRLMIVDVRWLYQKSRSNNFSNGLDDWSHHTYIPKKAGHAALHRKPSASLINHPQKANAKAMLIKRLDDKTLINEANEVNYEKAGATWNFPNGETGTFNVKFMLNEKSGGAQFSLTDRLFNGCDETTHMYAIYTLPIRIGGRIGRTVLAANKWYSLTFNWNGVGEKSVCKLSLDGKPAGEIKLNKTSPNGVSYFHLVSTAETADSGIIIESVNAKVK
ncbi:MAG: sialidase family protein [Lentisphaeria bacterium]